MRDSRFFPDDVQKWVPNLRVRTRMPRYAMPLVGLLVIACGSPRMPATTAQTPPARPAAATSAPEDDTPEGAAAVIRSYYDAINRRDYDRAYRYWSGEGAASGKTKTEFANGFAQTASVRVDIGTPGRIDPAAGSRFIDVPAEVTATNKNGAVERFRGKYVLRRSVVDGATAEQRQWRINSAALSRTAASEETNMKLEAKRTSPSTILLTLRNSSAHPAGYNLCSSALERRIDDTWTKVPTDDICTMEIRNLDSGKTATFEKHPSSSLPAAEYRYTTRVESPIGDKGVVIASDVFIVP